MSLEIKKVNAELAWKLYNYLNIWEDKIFGKKSSNNASYLFILTIIAFYGELSLTEIIDKSGVSYKEIYRYMEGLSKYYKFIENSENGYKLSNDLINSVNRSDIKVLKVNEQVFYTVLNNMKYHTQIFQEHLTLEKENGKFKMMRALLNPVVSNPIRAEDCRQLSSLGYMKYKPQDKKLKLNAVAYQKDWVGTHVI